jgi:hypothetical protein
MDGWDFMNWRSNLGPSSKIWWSKLNIVKGYPTSILSRWLRDERPSTTPTGGGAMDAVAKDALSLATGNGFRRGLVLGVTTMRGTHFRSPQLAVTTREGVQRWGSLLFLRRRRGCGSFYTPVLGRGQVAAAWRPIAQSLVRELRVGLWRRGNGEGWRLGFGSQKFKIGGWGSTIYRYFGPISCATRIRTRFYLEFDSNAEFVEIWEEIWFWS